jgi:hypothetical protein
MMELEALYEALKKVDYFGLRTYDEYCYFDSSHLISSANRKYQSVQQELLDYCLGKQRKVNVFDYNYG